MGLFAFASPSAWPGDLRRRIAHGENRLDQVLEEGFAIVLLVYGRLGFPVRTISGSGSQV